MLLLCGYVSFVSGNLGIYPEPGWVSKEDAPQVKLLVPKKRVRERRVGMATNIQNGNVFFGNVFPASIFVSGSWGVPLWGAWGWGNWGNWGNWGHWGSGWGGHGTRHH